MNIETEKLKIDSEKIIHILLKHLMHQRNEIAYIKNNAGLQLLDNYISINREGSKFSTGSISVLPEGSKQLFGGKVDSPEGSKLLFGGKADSHEGSKQLLGDKTDSQEGSKLLFGDKVDSPEGSKQLFGDKMDSPEGSNGDIWLHSVFEQRLIEALEQYIKNADGQNSLYAFYADFVDAVAEKNEEEAIFREAEKQIPLEDTHFLPEQITIDGTSISKLKTALIGHFATSGQCETVAKELLGLHNAGKATTAQICEFGGLSEGGIAKHLPRLQRAGLIKKQPPGNYALTEKSTHILLETFGIPKKQ